jgi:hypothetical protein
VFYEYAFECNPSLKESTSLVKLTELAGQTRTGMALVLP